MKIKKKSSTVTTTTTKNHDFVEDAEKDVLSTKDNERKKKQQEMNLVSFMINKNDQSLIIKEDGEEDWLQPLSLRRRSASSYNGKFEIRQRSTRSLSDRLKGINYYSSTKELSTLEKSIVSIKSKNKSKMSTNNFNDDDDDNNNNNKNIDIGNSNNDYSSDNVDDDNLSISSMKTHEGMKLAKYIRPAALTTNKDQDNNHNIITVKTNKNNNNNNNNKAVLGIKIQQQQHKYYCCDDDVTSTSEESDSSFSSGSGSDSDNKNSINNNNNNKVTKQVRFLCTPNGEMYAPKLIIKRIDKKHKYFTNIWLTRKDLKATKNEATIIIQDVKHTVPEYKHALVQLQIKFGILLSKKFIKQNEDYIYTNNKDCKITDEEAVDIIAGSTIRGLERVAFPCMNIPSPTYSTAVKKLLKTQKILLEKIDKIGNNYNIIESILAKQYINDTQTAVAWARLLADGDARVRDVNNKNVLYRNTIEHYNINNNYYYGNDDEEEEEVIWDDKNNNNNNLPTNIMIEKEWSWM